MDGRRRKTVHDADAAAGGTSEGRQPLVDVHGVHVRDAHVAIVRRPHVRAIGHANRAYEVFRRYRSPASPGNPHAHLRVRNLSFLQALQSFGDSSLHESFSRLVNLLRSFGDLL